MAERICANPECPNPIDPERVRRYDAKTCDAACRAAAFRARHGIRRVSDGAEPVVASKPRANGSRSGPSGAQVSFRRAVGVVADLLVAEAGWDPGPAYDLAQEWLGEALSEKQRARLAARP